MKYQPKTALTLLLLGVLVMGTLSGCGIKPGRVASPSGEENDQFPHTYPDPAHDPASGQP